MFDKVLVANRGEIAVRVIRGLREMGIQSAAVYSEADRKALHVLLADEAVLIGPSPASESYLVAEKILDAARSVGAQAIHPGYGFLSENADFSAACEAAGIAFIGPGPDAIRAMGDKAQAKEAVSRAGVPVVPGSLKPVTDEEAPALAEEIGYPVLLKAAKGGGGKGMRVVNGPDEMEKALRLVRGEAASSFGSDDLLVEKFVKNPRHVEAQILADKHGRTVFVGERECSVQRRHQKVIEEAPSPSLGEERRTAFGEVAVKAAQSVGYTNAGTVEFLLAEDGSYYFLEMNTRLQVEHPVTEETTGVDLVKEQIKIAAGEKLTLPDRIPARGHAIECRIYAEDASKGFMPSVGTIHFQRTPAGPGVRTDSGVYTGYEVPIYYDPMLAKLITWGKTREEAVRRASCALIEYRIEGPTTNIPFLRWILNHPDFMANNVDTGWLERVGDQYENIGYGFGQRYNLAALAAALFMHRSTSQAGASGATSDESGLAPWVRVGRTRRLGGHG
ncbi:MAG: acetyl-CoA carboxylase biotin carboxylase subunit [Gemmatimonadota bacterium]|nr:MAG: acetyl-CoA carboxylase biotin carboxylase subunit [Gemmatimonadota bacterium]